MIIKKMENVYLHETFELLNELYNKAISKDTFEQKFDILLKDKNFYGIIALEEYKVIGVLTARLINRIVKEKNILFIDDLIVSEEFRNRGIGKKMLNEAIEFAKTNNCETVELKSYISNLVSHKLYENTGFEKKHYNFKYIIK